MFRYELNLRDYLRIIRKRKYFILLSMAIFAAGSMMVDKGKVSIYEAYTTVQVQERKSTAEMLTEIMIYKPGDTMETELNIIRGSNVMIKVAKEFGLISEEMDQEQRLKTVEGFKSRIRTERVGNTNIIRILARAGKAQEAKDLANITAKVYIEESLVEKRKMVSQQKETIEKTLKLVEEKLYAAEDKLKAFNEKIDNISAAGDLQKKIVELQFAQNNLLKKYTEKHPQVIAITQELEELQSQMKLFSGKELEYERLSREVKVTKDTYNLLSQRYEEVKIAEAGKVAGAEVVDPATLPSSPINGGARANGILGMIMGLVIGLVFAFISETLDTSMTTIEDVETVVKLPVLGIVPSVAPELSLEETFSQKVIRKLVPRTLKNFKRSYVSLIVHRKPTSPIAEAFRNIKVNLKISPERKVFLITSAGPQEGKTTTLINIALACVQDGLKTLIISSDLRRPTICESFGIKKRPGISDYLMGTATQKESMRNVSDLLLGKLGIDTIVQTPGLDRLWIYPAGSLPLNPAELLKSGEFDKLLQWMRDNFDVVMFDSPPVLPVVDASILAEKMDAVVLCYEIGRTSRHVLVRAKEQLEKNNAKLKGIILNHIEPETDAVEVYPYYYRYRYYPKSTAKDDIL